ncbi:MULTISPECIES: hypothetical protein [unclassified Aeromicrobium]|uniref:hypothetical protein n=1 Tax=unclassified Aeromicrobium TaxID=2633570 RepID=UPI00396B120C
MRKHAHLKREYKSEIQRVSAILFENDPVGINFGENADEYEPEAADIVRRLPEASGPEDLARIVRDVFVHWFGAESAVRDSSYAELARRIWRDPWGHYEKDTVHSGHAYPVSRSRVGSALTAAGARTGRLYFSMPDRSNDFEPLVLARAYWRGNARANYHGAETSRAEDGMILWIDAVPKDRLPDARRGLETEGLARAAEWIVARLRAAAAGEALATSEADFYVFIRNGEVGFSEAHPSQL